MGHRRIDESKSPAMLVRRENDSYKMSRSRSRSEKYKQWTLDGVTDQPPGVAVHVSCFNRTSRGSAESAARSQDAREACRHTSTFTSSDLHPDTAHMTH